MMIQHTTKKYLALEEPWLREYTSEEQKTEKNCYKCKIWHGGGTDISGKPFIEQHFTHFDVMKGILELMK